MKITKICFLIIFIIFLTGCWNYTELNDMAITSVISIEKENDNFLMNVQIVDVSKNTASDSSSSQETPTVYEGTGRTTHEALRKVILSAPKKLYFAHLEVLAFDEEVAKNGIRDTIDFFMEDIESQKDFVVVIVRNQPAQDILKVLTPIEKISGTSIFSSIQNSTKFVGTTDIVSFDKFVANYLKEGIEPTMPAVVIKTTNNLNESSKNNQEALSSFADKIITVNSTAVFKGEQLVGYLDEKDSIGYNFVIDNINNNVISFPCDDEKYASMEIFSSKTKLEVKPKYNTVKTNINIDISGTFSEVECKIDLSDNTVLEKLKRQAEKEVNSIIKNSIKTVQDNYSSDIFGFGQYLYQNNYQYWQKNKKNWDEIFKNIEPKLNINIDVVFKTSTVNVIKGEK